MASSSVPRTLLVNNLVYQHFLALAGLTENYETVGEIVRHLIDSYQAGAAEKGCDTQLMLIRQKWAKKFPGSEPLRIEEVYNVLDRVERRIAGIVNDNRPKVPKPRLRSIDGGVSGNSARVEHDDCLSLDSRRSDAGLRIIAGGKSISGAGEWTFERY